MQTPTLEKINRLDDGSWQTADLSLIAEDNDVKLEMIRIRINELVLIVNGLLKFGDRTINILEKHVRGELETTENL